MDGPFQSVEMKRVRLFVVFKIIRTAAPSSEPESMTTQKRLSLPTRMVIRIRLPASRMAMARTSAA